MNQRRTKEWLRVPLWIILAVAAGALLLGAVVFGRDYRREKELLNNIFLQRGELLIHSLEMVWRMRDGANPPESFTLFWNNLEESDSVLFMALTDDRGRILALAGETAPGAEIFQNPESGAGRPRRRLERLNGESIYVVYRPFQPRPRGMRHHNMMMRRGHGQGRGAGMGGRESRFDQPTAGPRYVWVGFNMAPFEAASRERMRTAALFVVLFSLAGLGGVLALFWGHNSRLTRKMYEDIRAELIQKRRLAALGSLAAGLAHEIRNPLGAVRGLSQHLLNKGTGDPADRETLEVMLASVDRLNSTITDFLDYARPAEIKAGPLDAAELLRKLAALAAHDARGRGVEVKLELPPEPLMINGDEGRLAQAFLNLYLNAIDAAGGREDRNGLLTVTLAGIEDRAVITFRDNGPGFSPEQLAQAFTPYFTTKADGAGLGLALVEKCIHAHAGAEISLAAPAGGGALATVSFPILKPEDQA